MRPSSSLPNKEMAWLGVPLVIAPLAYTIEFALPLLLGGRWLEPPPGSLGFIGVWLIGAALTAIPAYVLGLPAAWLLERMGTTGFFAFGVAGAITAALPF